jgi:hypothetical protein
MNNAVRTRFDVWNRSEEPIVDPNPPVVDITVEELEEDLEVFTKFCGTAGGYDVFVERIED